MSLRLLELGSPAIALSCVQAAGGLLAFGGVLALGLPILTKGSDPVPVNRPKGRNPLLVRYGSALGTVAVFVVAAYGGGLLFTAVMALLVAIAWLEFRSMGRALGTRPFDLGGIAVLLVFGAGALLGPSAIAPALALGLLVLLCGGLRSEVSALPARLGLTLLGVVYVGLFATYMHLVRQGPAGYGHFCLYFAVIQVADTFAFLGGRAFGKHPLAPTLSPGKTWEGALVGLAAALVTARIFMFGVPGMPLVRVLAIGAALFVTSVLGDLVASAFKRSAGLKDFGTLLPEQGGILDRFDGYLFSAPVAFYLFQFLAS